jgi:hypothetical protein
MNKKFIKPGMKLQNRISGSVGEALADEDGKLRCIDKAVQVRRRIKSGKNEGRYDYPIWNVGHVFLP